MSKKITLPNGSSVSFGNIPTGEKYRSATPLKPHSCLSELIEKWDMYTELQKEKNRRGEVVPIDFEGFVEWLRKEHQ